MSAEVGQQVSVTRLADSWLNDAQWWPVDGVVTGTVTRLCANGTVYVAVDQFRNNSTDGRLTKKFSTKDKVVIAEIQK